MQLAEMSVVEVPLPAVVLDAEDRFYREYAWCLNPCLTVRQAGEHLTQELARLSQTREAWQRREVMTNIYLLAGTMLNSVDDYLRGPVYQLPRLAGMVPFAKWALKTVETVGDWARAWRVSRAAGWRASMMSAYGSFLRAHVQDSDAVPSAAIITALNEAVIQSLPSDLESEYTHLPSCFRKLDLTPEDVVSLGREFMARYPDRQQPVLAVGLRTAGSYFGPLFRAFLEVEGYSMVDEVTLRPDKGLGNRERKLLAQFSRGGHRAAILDDPPVSGETFAHAADVLRENGFPADRIVALFPVHPSQRRGPSANDSPFLSNVAVLTVEPEHWQKSRLLETAAVEVRLAEYFQNRGYVRATIQLPSARADLFNAQLESHIEEERRTRLKRVFEVQLEKSDGSLETRFVLAKSVGAGYLAYHAYLAGRRLAGMVPPMLGLRDGLLFSEWLPQKETISETPREAWIHAIASYTAGRTSGLAMPTPPTPEQNLHKYNHGLELLEKVLSKAYGHPALSKLMRSRVRRRLASVLSPMPTLIDGKMRSVEWVTANGSLLKTDFEHHGMGKNEVNVVDPAYDLADAVLQFSLSAAEENRLLACYRERSGDATIEKRLFFYKLLAGQWAMAGAMRNMQQPDLAGRHEEFHRDFVKAWDFLTAQTARRCGELCRADADLAWKSPLVVLDVDGVIDRRIFGFPCTSAAGVQAISLLHAHGLPIAINTARSVHEVREYCSAYGFAGAVAEYGSYVWDAVRQRGKVLLSGDALRQLERARTALGRLPGVFVNDGYEYSIKACNYEAGAPVPLPEPMVRRMLVDHDLDQLVLHQTSIDSTLTVRSSNKGTGLTALLDYVGLSGAETWGVGDSEPDLEMFRVASRSFAPGHIGCARQARFLGCTIVQPTWQRGLLAIARSLVHADGGHCDRCDAVRNPLADAGDEWFFDLLKVADESRARLALRAFLHPAVLHLLVR